MKSVDLNADLGEEVTDDEALLSLVTSANVACGYHAGTPVTMRAVCAEAARMGVAVGAQVSYADREHFGRVARDVQADLLAEQVADQVGTLTESRCRRGRLSPTSSRTARSTTGSATTPSRRPRCSPGPGTCRSSASPGPSSTWQWRPGARRTSRCSPTASTGATVSSRVTSRAP